MTMITSTVLGVMAAQAFRKNFRGKTVAFYLIVLGMIVPGVLVGLGSALVATTTGIERHWWSTAFATHVVYTLPFAFLVMLAIFNRFDASVEEASWSLGVSPITTFRKVTFPLIFPGVLSAMLFAFTLSYDEFSRTLFSSDMFTHVWRDAEKGPWIVTEADNDPTSPRHIRSFLLNTRYWWLEGAPTDSIRRGIGNVFDTYDVETIAPGYGCILRGRNVVERHYRMLDEILKGLDKRVAVSRYVGREEER